MVGKAQGLFQAEAEIGEIRSLYQSEYGQDPSFFDGETVTTDLLERLISGTSPLGPYDIIHFIGHGDSEANQVWLELLGTPFLDHNVPALLNGNPIVFFNCCFSGTSTITRYRYQADVLDAFGSRLLAAGASHFIGPLFPVRDDTARRLAVSFYRHIFAGETVGRAFYLAKLDASADPIALTYILYGNPVVRIDDGH